MSIPSNSQIGSAVSNNIRYLPETVQRGSLSLQLASGRHVTSCLFSGIYLQGYSGSSIIFGGTSFRNTIQNISLVNNDTATEGNSLRHSILTNSNADTVSNILLVNQPFFSAFSGGTFLNSYIENITCHYNITTTDTIYGIKCNLFERSKVQGNYVKNVSIHGFPYYAVIINEPYDDVIGNIVDSIYATNYLRFLVGQYFTNDITQNKFRNASSATIDGIFIDYGHDSSVVRNNTISNLYGKKWCTGISIRDEFSRVYNNTVENLRLEDTAMQLYDVSLYGIKHNITPVPGLSHIAGNTIRGLHYKNGTNIYYRTGTVIGISAVMRAGDSISNNIVEDILVQPTSTIGKTFVEGIYVDLGSGNAVGVKVNNNKISHVSISGTGTNARMFGINANKASIYNNIVQLGVNRNGIPDTANYNVYGIVSLYNSIQGLVRHNTVYIAGNVPGSNKNSMAAYVKGTPERVENNILVNMRTTPGGNAKNYAYVSGDSQNGAVHTNNIYYTPNANGYTASLDTGATPLANLVALQAAIAGQNTNSKEVDPGLVNALADISNASFVPAISSPATAAGSSPLIISHDYFYAYRPSVPTIGAVEFGGSPVLKNVGWACGTGTTTALFALPENIQWDSVIVQNEQNVTVQVYASISDSILIPQLQAGIYNVYFKEGTNVSLKYAVQVIGVVIPATPQASNTTTCSGSSGTVTATGAANYQWYNAPIGGSVLGTNSWYTSPPLTDTTTYYVQTTDSTCASVRKAVTVQVIKPATPNVYQDDTLCSNTFQILITSPHTGHVTKWTTQNGGFEFGDTILANDSVIFYVQSYFSGCSSSVVSFMPIAKPAPLMPVVIDSYNICTWRPSTVAMNDEGYTYKWYADDQSDSLIHTGSNYTFTPVSTAPVRFYVSASNSECESYRKLVVINPGAVPKFHNPDTLYHICQGGNILLGLTQWGQQQYTWYNALNSDSAIATANTLYLQNVTTDLTLYVQVNNADCKAPLLETKVLIGAIDTPQIEHIAICSDSVLTLAAAYQGTLIPLWFTDTTQAPISVSYEYVTPLITESSIYYVANVLSICTSAYVPLVIYHAGVDTPLITQSGNILTSTSAQEYQWYRNGVLINGASQQSFTADSTGLYTVIAGNFYCKEASAPVEVVIIPTDIGLKPAIENIELYPNPAKEQLTVKVDKTTLNSAISIYAITGQLVLKQMLITNAQTIDITSLPEGIYIWNILAADKVHTGKVTIAR